MRVTYVSAPTTTLNLLATINDLVYVYDDDHYTTRVVDGTDFFEGNCGFLISYGMDDVRTHPIGSYNIVYPYARTSIRIRMDDPMPTKQFAQLVAVAPYLAVRIMLEDSAGKKMIPISATIVREPDQLFPCAAVVYYNPIIQEPYLIVNTLEVSLPARISLNITDTLGHVRDGWIGIRSKRDGTPSGAIL